MKQSLIIIVVFMWLSGLGGLAWIHAQKTIKVPRSNHYKVQVNNNNLDIFLSSSINSSDSYLDLIMLMKKHPNYNLRIYLSGDGGTVRATLDLYHAIQTHKGEVTMVVRGNVYSAHASLALAGDRIEIENPHILFLFHIPAINTGIENITLEQYCSIQKGTDRGISQKEKCNDFVKKYKESLLFTLEARMYAVLTEGQLIDYYSGKDVIVTGQQIAARLSKNE